MKIRITAQNGHTWEEEIDDDHYADACEDITLEHGDIETIDVVDDDGHIIDTVND